MVRLKLLLEMRYFLKLPVFAKFNGSGHCVYGKHFEANWESNFTFVTEFHMSDKNLILSLPYTRKAFTSSIPTDVETIDFAVLTCRLEYHHAPLKWSFREKKNAAKAQHQQNDAVRILFTLNGLSMSLLSSGNCNGSLSNTKLILKLFGWLLRPSSWELCIYLSRCQYTSRGVFQWV